MPEWDFTALAGLPSQLRWLHPPPSSELVRGKGLVVSPAAQTDFWQKTYYEPLLEKASGHALLCSPPAPERWSAELTFSLDARNQFDQAGLLVWGEAGCWLKAGIEWVDSCARMSCVATSGRSDWSVQPWGGGARDVRVRVSHVRESFVVEAKAVDEDKWELMRITYLSPPASSRPFEVGPYCCAPTAAGFVATFSSLEVSEKVTFDHHA